MRTIWPKENEIDKKWLVIDAEGQNVGRLSSKVAVLLRGKHKPCYTPNIDCGDNVVIVNAEKVVFTGKKMTDKVYLSHTGYPGGQRAKTPVDLMNKFPERILEKSIRGMLPKNRLGRKLYKHLHIQVGDKHKFEAQKPQEYNI